MEQYPSIDSLAKIREVPYGKPCLAYYKYDGSNLRWEWSPKRGWSKFGTRRQLFDATSPVYANAIQIFMDTMSEEIVRRVLSLYPKMERITAFTEYFGPGSFAGQHVPDDPMELRLFDVYLYKRGLMSPNLFRSTFEDLPYAPELIYQGPFTEDFARDVRAGKYPVWEGVICKGTDWTVKVKTQAYFDKLKEVYGNEYGKYWE